MFNNILGIGFASLLYFSAVLLNADELPVGSFSKSGMEAWRPKVFAGKTSYQISQTGDIKVLRAESRDSASALIKKIRVDIKKYPYLNWSWKIENRLDTVNEKIKAGDDYAARIYVIIDGGIFLWKTKAINYVWATSSSKGETWANAFAGKNAMMMAVRNKEDKISTWFNEKRNVYEDLKKLFGSGIDFIDAVAVMTDSDNSHGKTESYYGDIFFSSE